ncbi:MAG TPA: hypothetical protein PK413_14855 [Thermoanaerobaculia bacterium]|nr:hypothetical protein [Thermoanaerobaculia bacterium]
MRTTLTLEPDVEARLRQRLENHRELGMKELVNRLLRLGLDQDEAAVPAPKRFRVRTFAAGRCFFPNLDDTEEALAFAEGEDHR